MTGAPGPIGGERLRELRDAFDKLSRRGSDLVRKGRFGAALEAYTSAQELARQIDDAELVQKTASNICMVRLEMGDLRAGQRGLREIMLRSRNDRIVLGASYNLAVSLRKQGNHSRAGVYARRAIELSRRLRDASALAMCYNLLGNISLGRSLLDDALRHYRRALRLVRKNNPDNRYLIAMFIENIGYCLILKRQFRRGMTWIERALAMATETGDRRCQADCQQDLAYAYLLLSDHGRAARHGGLALEIALAEGYRDIERNCYYLLGETAHLTGEGTLRDEYFSRLQAHYPNVPFLRDFLCAVDVSGIITLKA